MLFDLIRALLAAFVVAVAPGWFWAGLLRSPTGHAERVVYSAALSMALVPVVALVAVYLLGTGVTLAVALISPSLVFCAGLAAYLRLGPAKSSGEPVLPISASPLGVPALGLLVIAFGLAIGVMIGAIPGEPVEPPITGAVVPGPRVLGLICALVAAAGLIQLVLSRTAERQGFTGPQEETAGLPPLSFPPSWRRLSLLAVLVVVLARGYLGPALHEWPFMRGVDHYSHAVMANRMMTEGKIEPYLIYPPGFHTVTAMISRLSALEPLEIFPVLGPTLLLLPAFALYALARWLWGFEYGLAAALLSVILGGTYYYFNDAMYPNLVAAQFLMVLTLAALVGMYASPSLRGGVLLALLGSSVVLYHQVASLYLALLLALVGAYFLPLLLLRDRRRGVALLFSLAALGSLSVVYAWDTYDLGGTIAGSSTTGDAVGMAVGTQAPYGMGLLLGTMVSQPVAWLGLLGAILLVGDAWRRGGLPVAHITLLLWALILFVGSRTSLTGFPQRFGRDLGVPLALLAALALITILRSLAPHRRAVVFVTSAAVLLAVSLVGMQTAQSLKWASGPSIQVTVTPEISAAGEWLEEHNKGGNIIVSPHINQVPSRMMLAMGHYSALQSFELWQVQYPRDLPPTGPGPLMDVIWVVTHPEGGRTESILRERDIRYVVLYKNMPDRPTADFWRLFKAQPGLYRTTFENRDVLIVEPR
ncbi:MAG: hypothetical protein M3151_13415 [Actinomycetota bacterium]|nr:hypothetical protein [Actinomycetota bacterium]